MGTNAVEQALAILGKKRVLLQIHDPSFPGRSDEDVGRGTPYGTAGAEFARFAKSIGFTGLQLGPQGQTTRGNPSPYDSTAFSRNFLSLSFAALRGDEVWGELVDDDLLDSALTAAAGAPSDRTQHQQAYDAQLALCNRAFERYREARSRATVDTRELDRFREHNRFWLEPDAMYEALSREYGTTDWRRWSGPNAEIDRSLYCAPGALRDAAASRRAELTKRYADDLERYALVQYLVHRQHQQFHRRANEMGLSLYADLQVGLALRDRWRLHPLFLGGYLLGAPPSRTNAEGQPWGYPVLDPDLCAGETPAGSGVGYLASRARKLFAEFDGVRLDHPQGLVCPWVYRSDDPDPFHAVQNGARLFSSPALAGHPVLARYAIARADQLATGGDVARHADEWVAGLEPEQVDRYATLLSVIMDEARSRGLDPRSIACETLSTQPYPLKRVMEKFGLGRFRVTQKMDVGDPADVYRTDNAVEADWVMMGNHDTRPIWARVAEWEAQGKIRDRAAYLAHRLAPSGEVDTLRRRIAGDRGTMVHAYFADLLVSDAQNVIVFFADLFGSDETYNTPGTVGPENWSLRVPSDYQERYRHDAGDLRALNIAYACSFAMKSPLAEGAPHELGRQLERVARQSA